MTRKIIASVLLTLSIMICNAQEADVTLIFNIDENTPNGTLIGTVTASDPDGDVLSFSFISGNESDAFSIGASSGDIFVNDETVLDFETTPTFNLMVEADDGNGGVTTASVTINLNDIDETVLGLGDEVPFDIYPNPVENFLTISGDIFDLATEPGFYLYSLDGTKTQINLIIQSENRLELDFRNVSSGVYILRVSNEESILGSRRIVVR